MSQIHREGELSFEFPDDVAVERLDRHTLQNTKLVDFVVERTDHLLLIEVKDYVSAGARSHGTELPEGLVDHHLAPKARGSYGFLHLMKRDTKPLDYVVLLEMPDGLDSAILDRLNRKLTERLRKEADQPWKREYIRYALVMTLEQWNRRLPEYPVKRS